jgi:protein transport protein SEC24
MASFHGNFFVRSTDLLAMPAVPQDQSYAIEIQIEESITAPFVVFQTAVLHTTCYGQSKPPNSTPSVADNPWLLGERRIRVITMALPVTSNLSEVFASADQVAIATLLANKAVERSLTHKLEDARDAVTGKMVEILQAYKASMTAAGAGASAQLATSENLKMLPALVLGLLKNVRLWIVQGEIALTHPYHSGWYPPKFSDPSRPPSVRAGTSVIHAVSAFNPLPLSNIVLAA